jgi:hypothetical protein
MHQTTIVWGRLLAAFWHNDYPNKQLAARAESKVALLTRKRLPTPLRRQDRKPVLLANA